MKTFKSDGRYNLHSQGFHYIAQFRWHGTEDKKLFHELRGVLIELYGHTRIYDEETAKHTWNTVWRFEETRSAKRRRIYLKDESVLTLALLKIGVENGN